MNLRIFFFFTFFFLSFCSLLSNPCQADLLQSLPQNLSKKVNDFSNILDQRSRQVLEYTLSQLQQQTGVQCALVLVPSLQGDDVDSVASRLFERWGIGNKDKDNGILILFAQQDRQVRIEVGYGLEGTLPDGKVGAIIRESMVPYFKQQRYSQGLFQGVLAITSALGVDSSTLLQTRTLEKRTSSPRKKLSPFTNSFSVLIFCCFDSPLLSLPFFVFFLFTSIDGRTRGRWFWRWWFRRWGRWFWRWFVRRRRSKWQVVGDISFVQNSRRS